MKKSILFSILTLCMYYACQYSFVYLLSYPFSKSFLIIFSFSIPFSSFIIWIMLKYSVIQRKIVFSIVFVFLFGFLVALYHPHYEPPMGGHRDVPNHGGIQIPYTTK